MTLSQSKKSRKRKVGPRESKELDNSESPVKKPKSIPVAKVQSIIVEQLTSSDSRVVSSALASLASSEEDKVEEFLAGGGNAGHILHSLDSAEGKVRANDLAAVFCAIDAIVGHIVRYVRVYVVCCALHCAVLYCRWYSGTVSQTEQELPVRS